MANPDIMITSISKEKLSSARHLQVPRFFQVTTLPDGCCIAANDLFKKKFGLEAKQIPEHSFIKSIAADYIDQFHTAAEACLRQQTIITVELKHQLPDIEQYVIYWEVSCTPSSEGDLQYLQWIGMYVQDNEYKKADEQLKQSELFRALIADSLDGVLLTNEGGTISFASASVMNILGYEPDEVLEKNAFDFVHPDDIEMAFTSFSDEVNQSPKRKFIAIRLLQKTGEWLWCMVRGHNQLFNPAVGKMLIYFSDDSYRRNIEEALIKSRERFFHLIQHLNIGIVLCDIKGAILLSNQACHEIFQYKENELTGKNVFDPSYIVFDENNNRLSKEEYPVAKAIASKSVIRNHIIGVKRNEIEKTTWLQINVQPVLESGGLKHLICSFIDISEQRYLAKQLAQQQKQKQKQLMRANIDGQEKERSEISRELHDNISQQLTTIRLYMEVAKDKAEGQLFEMISQTHKSIIHVSDEIRRLSQSLAPPELRDIGLIESISDLCDQLKKLHSYEVDFEYDQSIEETIADCMKLMLFRIIQEQINNIIRHAHANRIEIKLHIDAGNMCLSIADNGIGFDTSLVKKGLGLTNIFNRVNLYDGQTEIVASPGNGCHLCLIVPLK